MKRWGGVGQVLAIAPLLVQATFASAEKPTDVVWKHPDPGRFDISTIAVLPVVAVDGDDQAVSMIEKAVPWKWIPTGHGWLQASSSRDRLRREGGEALLRALSEQIRRGGRVDSATALPLTRALHMGAFLAVRVDKWEQYERDRRQLKAKPSFTTIGLRLALVDSTGTLLWSVSGSEIMREASGQSAAAARSWEMRPGAFGMGLQSVTTAPPFEEVLGRLLARWKTLFLAARGAT